MNTLIAQVKGYKGIRFEGFSNHLQPYKPSTFNQPLGGPL